MQVLLNNNNSFLCFIPDVITDEETQDIKKIPIINFKLVI